MQLNQIILILYPDLKDVTLGPLNPDRPYVLQDDGDGVYIKEWNDPRPQPTEKQLAELA